MKQKLAFLLMITMMFYLVGCGKSSLSGKYLSEEKKYSVSFTSDSECTWYQDGMFFDGTYKKTDSGYQLEIAGDGFYSNTVFNAEVDGDDLIISGGIVDQLRFTKE